MMPDGIPEAGDGELVAKQLHFGAQITKSQKDQQNRKPTGRSVMATPYRIAAALSQGSGPKA